MPKHQSNALHQAVSAALAGLDTPQFVTAPQSATARHNAPRSQNPFCQTNPPPLTRPPRPLSHRQLLALQFLAAGHTLTQTAALLRLHRYTLTRWLKNPLFQAHLDRRLSAPVEVHVHDHVTGATKRHIAPQSATTQGHVLPNEPTDAPNPPPSPHVPKHYTWPSPNDAPNKEL